MFGFIYAFFQRVLSGAQNMYGYSKKKGLFLLLTIIMLLFPFINYRPDLLFLIFVIVNAFDVYMKAASFNLLPYMGFLKRYRDIHFWEDIVTGGYFLFLILAHFNILYLICSVYPALILHKGLINKGSGLSFFSAATDDNTIADGNPVGATYSIPLLGIKIKRSGTKFRLILASISLIAAALIFIFGWNLSL